MELMVCSLKVVPDLVVHCGVSTPPFSLPLTLLVSLIFTAPPLLSEILSAPPFDDMSASLFEDSYCEKMQPEVFNKALF